MSAMSIDFETIASESVFGCARWRSQFLEWRSPAALPPRSAIRETSHRRLEHPSGQCSGPVEHAMLTFQAVAEVDLRSRCDDGDDGLRDVVARRRHANRPHPGTDRAAVGSKNLRLGSIDQRRFCDTQNRQECPVVKAGIVGRPTRFVALEGRDNLTVDGHDGVPAERAISNDERVAACSAHRRNFAELVGSAAAAAHGADATTCPIAIPPALSNTPRNCEKLVNSSSGFCCSPPSSRIGFVPSRNTIGAVARDAFSTICTFARSRMRGSRTCAAVLPLAEAARPRTTVLQRSAAVARTTCLPALRAVRQVVG